MHKMTKRAGFSVVVAAALLASGCGASGSGTPSGNGGTTPGTSDVAQADSASTGDDAVGGTSGDAAGGTSTGQDAGSVDDAGAVAADAGVTVSDSSAPNNDAGGAKLKENTDDLCDDGKDNDDNGYTDCDDFGCSKNSKVTVCKGGGAGGPNSCVGKCGQYDENAACHCDDLCADFLDCCDDYKKVCGGSSPGSASCKDKCGDYDASAQCQCDEACSDAGDCCADFVQLCGGATGTTAPSNSSLVISELMVRSQSGTDEGEYVELHNTASATVDVAGYELVYKENVKMKFSAKGGKTVILGGGYLVIGRTKDAKKNHGAPVDYTQKVIGLGNGGGDIWLVNGKAVIDKVHYIKTDVKLGEAWQLSSDKMTALGNDSPTSWCAAKANYGTAGKKGTPGAANAVCK